MLLFIRRVLFNDTTVPECVSDPSDRVSFEHSYST